MNSRTGPGPIRVVLVDVDSELPEISPVRPAGGRYEAALVYVVRSGQIVAATQIAFDDTPLTPSRLRAHLSQQLGAVTAPSVAQAGVAPVDAVGDPPFISVVVASTLSRRDALDRCLTALSTMDYSAYEIIVVDNRPDSSSAREAEHRRLAGVPRVRVVVEPRPGIAAARNAGVRAATGEIIAFTDDDVVVHPRWLAATAARLGSHPRVDCVTGVVLPAELETPEQIWFERSGSKLAVGFTAVTYRSADSGPSPFAWLRRRAYEVVAEPDPTGDPAIAAPTRCLIYRAGTFGMGASFAFRATALRGIGGFDEALGVGTPARGGEDIAALARLLRHGGRITSDPAVIVHHYHRREPELLTEQMYGYGVGASAALAALVHRDPRHLIGLAHLLLPAVGVLAGRAKRRRVSDYPPELARVETRGLLAGPFAYLRSLRALRGHPTTPADHPSERLLVGGAAP